MAGIKRSFGGGGGGGKRFKFAKRTRRAFRAKRKGNTRNKTQVRAGLGFPKKMTMTHKYQEVISLTTSAGVLLSHSFSANGMFDPNVSGTGHQPYYFDQMTALYDHYTVIGAKITVVMSNTGSGEDAYKWALIINDDSTVTPTDISTIGENSSSSVKFVSQGSDVTTRLSKKWSAKKTFGGSVLGNDNLQGTSGNNPTEQSMFTICMMGIGANTITTYADVRIEYIAVWDELRDIAGS